MNLRSLLQLHMTWHDCAFAHWRADAERLTRVLPAGVLLDRFDGAAWLSVVPFRMTGVRLGFGPVVPGFAAVAEINLRTYVRVDGIPGVWFFSLDAASPLLVQAARITTGLPYFRARIETDECDNRIHYTSLRTDGRSAPAVFRARYTVASRGSPAQPGSLKEFLHERYRFFTLRGALIVCGTISHAPWTLGEMDIDILDNTLGEHIGHPLPEQPERTYFGRILTVTAEPVCPVARG